MPVALIVPFEGGVAVRVKTPGLTVIIAEGEVEMPPCVTVTLAVAVVAFAPVFVYRQVNWLPEELTNVPPLPQE